MYGYVRVCNSSMYEHSWLYLSAGILIHASIRLKVNTSLRAQRLGRGPLLRTPPHRPPARLEALLSSGGYDVAAFYTGVQT